MRAHALHTKYAITTTQIYPRRWPEAGRQTYCSRSQRSFIPFQGPTWPSMSSLPNTRSLWAYLCVAYPQIRASPRGVLTGSSPRPGPIIGSTHRSRSSVSRLVHIPNQRTIIIVLYIIEARTALFRMVPTTTDHIETLVRARYGHSLCHKLD